MDESVADGRDAAMTALESNEKKRDKKYAARPIVI
jgi:hypothetical protein